MDLTHNKNTRYLPRRRRRIGKISTISRDVIIYVQNNPIVCGCALYSFLRYLEGKMHKNVQNYIHIIPGNLTCHGPDYINDTPVDQLHSESFICPKPEPCPEGCSCWIRQSDNAFLVDCSYKKFDEHTRKHLRPFLITDWN